MAGTWVIEVTTENFQSQVIERSRELPVVVDFWAPWCGPCRALGPALEALAAEKDGGFLLAKINTDEHPDLAGAFQVSGIPAVFAIRDGKLVNHFEGLLPEPELRRFIDELAPTESEQSLSHALEMEGRDPAAATSAYRSIIAKEPDNAAARVGLARVLLTNEDQETEAEHFLSAIEAPDLAAEVERLRTIIQLREVPHSGSDLSAARTEASANSESAEAQYKLGRILAARGEYLPAMDALLTAAELDKKLGGTAIRETMVHIFNIIGPRSPEADDYRGRLRNLLY